MTESKTSATEVRGTVDFGIISVRVDEFEAVLKRFAPNQIVEGTRTYALSTLSVTGDTGYSVAMVRTPHQGHLAAAQTAEAMINDLDPRWILLVGIGGALPDAEYTLGDVMLGVRTVDFSVQAAIQGRPPEFDIRGSYSHPKVEDLLAFVPALQKDLAGWTDSIQLPLPEVLLADDKFYGDADWQSKTRRSLQGHFSKPPLRNRIFLPGTIGTSNTLVKDTDLAVLLGKFARSVMGFEMEVGGVLTAARRKDKEYPVLNIRGVSDVVGYKRDPAWTAFACEAAAAFAHRLVLSGKILPPRPISAAPSIAKRAEPARVIPAAFELIRSQTLTGIVRIHGLTWSPDGTRVACEASSTATLLNTGGRLVRIESNSGAFHNLSWSPDARYIVGGTAGGGLVIWDTDEGGVLGTLKNATSYATEDVSWAPTGREILSAQEGIVHLWSIEIDEWNNLTGSSQPFIRGGSNFSRLAYSPDGSMLATTDRGVIRIWDTASKQCLADAKLSHSFVWKIIWAPDNKAVAYWEISNAGIWEFGTGNAPVSLGGQPQAISFSHDAALIATVVDQSLQILRRDNLGLVASLVPAATHLSTSNAAFAPGADLIALSGETKRKPHDPEIQLWQLDRLKIP